MPDFKCRHCQQELMDNFINLGMHPLSNGYLSSAQLNESEKYYPLHAMVCRHCLLVQLPEFETPDTIFSDYLYFSSFSESWLDHAKTYAEFMIKEISLTEDSQVIEIASNDGYLLQYFKRHHIPVLGIEPARNVATTAINKGIPTRCEFFGSETAEKLKQEGYSADLMIANNVLAHVPDINDFVAGFKILLKPEGLITFEFPHIKNLINEFQFDTIYHEHFSYLSLHSVDKILATNGLKVVKVEKLPTHGGSLRVFATHQESKTAITVSVEENRQHEQQDNLDKIEGYLDFQQHALTIKHDTWNLIAKIKNQNKRIAAYGAAAKGNTFINYCGIDQQQIEFVVDANPHKQGQFLPGSHIPIVSIQHLQKAMPDYILILPWNLKSEIRSQLDEINDWGAQYVTAIPEIEVFS